MAGKLLANHGETSVLSICPVCADALKPSVRRSIAEVKITILFYNHTGLACSRRNFSASDDQINSFADSILCSSLKQGSILPSFSKSSIAVKGREILV
jgi:hypothetical protein